MTLMSRRHPKHRIANAKWGTYSIYSDILQFRLSNLHNEFLPTGGTGFPPTVTGNLRPCCGVQKEQAQWLQYKVSGLLVRFGW